MGASDSSRAIFRAIYKNAKGSVRIRNSDGTYTYSDAFEICRGVVQGDIFSPYCFIVALAVLMMRYDPIRYDDSSIKLDGLTTRIHALLYADDSSMVSKTASKISERLTQFEKPVSNMLIWLSRILKLFVCRS